MSRRLAQKAFPDLRAANISKISCHRPGRVFSSQPRRLYSSPGGPGGPAKKKQTPPTPKSAPKSSLFPFRRVKEPDSWCLSSKWDQAEGNNIALLHPENKQSLVLNRHVLRDACECSACVDPHSGQKNFGTTQMPQKLPVQRCRRLEDGSLEVVWENDFHTDGKAHTSVYPAKSVRTWFHGSDGDRPALPPSTLWDKKVFEASSSVVTYDDWMSAGPGFHAALSQLWRYGLVFIDGVPKSEESVIKIANQIGHVMETFYGRTWDVRSKPEAENVAYTSTFLDLHQDLLYTRDPPRIQLLHCLENTCEGGESIFSDSLRVAQSLLHGPRRFFRALQSRPVRYHYKKHGHYYEQLRTVIQHNGGDVFWSPPFQSPEQPCPKDRAGSAAYSTWLQGAKIFRELLEDENYLYENKLQAGQCVIFDNLRVLHGRRKFDTSAGSRWLKGTYVSSDEWNSKAMTLSKEISTKGGANSIPPFRQAESFLKRHGSWHLKLENKLVEQDRDGQESIKE